MSRKVNAPGRTHGYLWEWQRKRHSNVSMKTIRILAKKKKKQDQVFQNSLLAKGLQQSRLYSRKKNGWIYKSSNICDSFTCSIFSSPIPTQQLPWRPTAQKYKWKLNPGTHRRREEWSWSFFKAPFVENRASLDLHTAASGRTHAQSCLDLNRLEQKVLAGNITAQWGGRWQLSQTTDWSKTLKGNFGKWNVCRNVWKVLIYP